MPETDGRLGKPDGALGNDGAGGNVGKDGVGGNVTEPLLDAVIDPLRIGVVARPLDATCCEAPDLLSDPPPPPPAATVTPSPITVPMACAWLLLPLGDELAVPDHDKLPLSALTAITANAPAPIAIAVAPAYRALMLSNMTSS
jgi:hypothetical protein